MAYQAYIDPTMLNQTIAPEANELSFDLDEFINQYTSYETLYQESLNTEDQSRDMTWQGSQLTAVQSDHSMPTSGFQISYALPEDLEQFLYSFPECQPQLAPSERYPSPPSSENTSSSQASVSQSSQSSPSCSTSSSSSAEHKCNFCPKTFEKKHLLNRHEKQHTKPISCPAPGCSHSTAKRRDMQRHIVVHHRDDYAVAVDVVVPQLKCPVVGCKYAGAGEGFKRQDHLVRHVKRKHPGMSP